VYRAEIGTVILGFSLNPKASETVSTYVEVHGIAAMCTGFGTVILGFSLNPKAPETVSVCTEEHGIAAIYREGFKTVILRFGLNPKASGTQRHAGHAPLPRCPCEPIAEQPNAVRALTAAESCKEQRPLQTQVIRTGTSVLRFSACNAV
jgi:hypothetical protein